MLYGQSDGRLTVRPPAAPTRGWTGAAVSFLVRALCFRHGDSTKNQEQAAELSDANKMTVAAGQERL
jgi:hypothetical protein